MSMIDLVKASQSLPKAWSSTLLGLVGSASIKLLRMDAAAYVEETHDYNEALIVIEGILELEVGAQLQKMRAGQMYIVQARTPHLVRQGSSGTLMIVDI